jgi:hypothetical protein
MGWKWPTSAIFLMKDFYSLGRKGQPRMPAAWQEVAHWQIDICGRVLAVARSAERSRTGERD